MFPKNVMGLLCSAEYNNGINYLEGNIMKHIIKLLVTVLLVFGMSLSLLQADVPCNQTESLIFVADPFPNGGGIF